MVADNGFRDGHTEHELSAFDLDCLVYHRGSRPMAATHNALDRSWRHATQDGGGVLLGDEASARRHLTFAVLVPTVRETVLVFALRDTKGTVEKAVTLPSF